MDSPDERPRLFNHEAYANVERLQHEVRGALACATVEGASKSSKLVAISKIEECGRAFVEFERVNGNTPEVAQRLHDAFYHWATSCLRLVSS